MDYFVSISAIRLEIPEFRGKKPSEVFKFFRNLLGDPDEYWTEDGEPSFYYDHETRGVRPVTDGERWGLDIILTTDFDNEIPFYQTNISFFEAMDKVRDFSFKFGLKFDPLEARIVSYTFYEDDEEEISFG